MASNQLHGKKFEDFIKSSFPGSSDNHRMHTSVFDIEAKYDKELGINTSIKSKKKNANNNEIFELSDARRMFSMDEDYRMIVGLYEQDGDRKVFVEIIEYIIKKENLSEIKGNLSYEEVSEFHKVICSFKPGYKGQQQGKVFCSQIKPSLQEKTLITLNPKIDSKKQRRLQCSVKRRILDEIIPKSQIKIYSDVYRGLVLPIKIISEKRVLSKKIKKPIQLQIDLFE